MNLSSDFRPLELYSFFFFSFVVVNVINLLLLGFFFSFVTLRFMSFIKGIFTLSHGKLFFLLPPYSMLQVLKFKQGWLQIKLKFTLKVETLIRSYYTFSLAHLPSPFPQ